MADKNKGEINYVSQMRFWSDAYRRELVAQNKLWPQKYGFLVDEYRKMNEQMDKGKPLPVKALRVKEEDFRRFEPDPDKKQFCFIQLNPAHRRFLLQCCKSWWNLPRDLLPIGMGMFWD
ncbi:hypothetical protein RRG08_019426 [Elysia crispata]|uniref:Uncharacterized protein n=1 Tax=Elysia crispata TaxID=231223 RepID=A0AAE1D984_9GAST|nr:hypothetical protein RRG08_019426 [Elysia crispata]